jgi:hypothetical protein
LPPASPAFRDDFRHDFRDAFHDAFRDNSKVVERTGSREAFSELSAPLECLTAA